MDVFHLFPSRIVAFTVGPIDVHWYGIMYLLAFLIGMLLLPRLQKHRGLWMDVRARESLFVHVFLGVLLGGRLGYVLFYGSSYYLQHPAEIPAVWQGGMSSHGGFIGVIAALLLFTRRHNIERLALTDVVLIPVAIGLMLGRVGNFINQELYGTVTSLPWGMAFPGADGLRHPTQLYAILKDALIAGLLLLHLTKTSWTKNRKTQAGYTTALFLLLYGAFRFIVEHFREQPQGYVDVAGLLLSRGQLLTLPVFAGGVFLMLYLRSRSRLQ
jgi:phosphatidylglycerol---prolipoprotein diacylglyceryl transferase